MKIFSKLFATAFAVICFTSLSLAQFEGKLTMKMEALELPEEYASMKSMFESNIVIYTKGKKSRVETTTAMAGTSIALNDGDKGESYTCVDMMGQKLATKVTYDDSNMTEESLKGKFTPSNETKTIAGYKCIKGIYSMDAGGIKQDTEVWFTKDIANTRADMREIPGMLMEMIMEVQGMKLRYQVTEVSKEKVDNSKFDLPKGYTVVTPEEMTNKLMGK